MRLLAGYASGKTRRDESGLPPQHCLCSVRHSLCLPRPCRHIPHAPTYMPKASLASFRAPSLVLLPGGNIVHQLCTCWRRRGTHTADEAAGVDEHASVDAARLGEHVVAQAAPHLGQGLAAREALGRDRHSLHAPLSACLVGVEYIDGLLRLGDRELFLQLEEVLLPRRKLLEEYDLAA